MPLLLVMIGGALGAGARFLVGRAALALAGPKLPWGTLTANLSGGLFMGLLVGLLARHPSAAGEPIRLFAAVGILGGYTTFSSFSLETVNMIQRGQSVLAFGYVAASAAGAVLLVFAGIMLTRALPG